MIKYIKSELYRLFCGKGSYLFIIICSALLVSANVVLALVKRSDETFPYATTSFAMGMFYTSMIVIYLLCISVASIVFGNEYTNHTMKNTISYGISRGSIYFGKFISELIFALMAFIIITGIDIATAYLLLENSGSGPLQLLLNTCFVCLPLLFSSIAVTNCFIFIIDATGGAITAIIGTLIAFPLVCNLLGMKFSIISKFAEIIPYNLINNLDFDTDNYMLMLPWEGNAGYYHFWIIGMGWTLLFVLIGFFIFRTKEVK